MKKRFKYSMMAIAAIGMGALASCTNELNAPSPGGGSTSSTGVNIAYAPDFVAWSGSQSLDKNGINMVSPTAEGATTRSSGGFSGNAGSSNLANNIQYNDKWAPFESPTPVGDDELQKVLAAINVKTENGTKQHINEEIVFPWKNYYLQDVLRGEDSGCPSNSWSFYAYTSNADRNYAEVTNSGKINNFGQSWQGDSALYIPDTALMVNMGVGEYSTMQAYQFYFHMNCHEFADWFDSYIVVKVDGHYYICVDFACAHEENNVNGNPAFGGTGHDWDYNDWIIKISPAIPVNTPGYEVPAVWTGQQEPDPTPKPDPDDTENPGNNGDGDDNNGDDNNGDDNNGDDNNGDDEGDDNTGTGNNRPSAHRHNNEVEVNFAINDVHESPNGQKYESADLWTKLSIHVRKGTDVEIRIPLEKKYICESDDLLIFQGHEIDMSLPTDQSDHTVNYTITDGETTWNVSLNVNFNLNPDEIVVTTSGITEDLIEYLMDQNGDGINFEVYFYFQTEYRDSQTDSVVVRDDVSKDELREQINRSEITFLDDDPAYYINAFGVEYVDGKPTTTVHHYHATVKPADSSYSLHKTGYHLNGTQHNDIYVLQGVEPDQTHK